MMTRRDIARWLAQRDHFAILTHRRPDGDTTGSAAALCMGLRSLGKTAYVVENPEFTPKYAHLLPGLTQEAVAQGDTLISVDVAAPNMLPKAFEKFLERIALRIDHHGSATSFTELELVDPDAAACAEIIYDILMEMGVKLDEKMADALYTGVSTDTGCFRYANTEAHSFTVAAACAAAGGDENVRPAAAQLQRGAQALGIVAHHGVVMDIDADGVQRLGDLLGVGVDGGAHEQLRAHGDDLGGV